MLDSGALWAPPEDPRLQLHRAGTLTSEGAVKRRACIAGGEILVEYDHYDVLGSNAHLEKDLAVTAPTVLLKRTKSGKDFVGSTTAPHAASAGQTASLFTRFRDL